MFGKKYRGQLQVEQRLLYLGSFTIKSSFLLKSVLKFRGGRGSPLSLKRKEKNKSGLGIILSNSYNYELINNIEQRGCYDFKMKFYR